MSRLNLLLLTLVLAAASVGCTKSPANPDTGVPASVDAEDSFDIPADVTPATQAAEVTQAAG